MGREKDRLIQEWEQGWQFTDETVCYRCLSDPYLRELARQTATESKCSFCSRSTRREASAIPFDDLMEVIGSAINQYYGHVEDEPIAWDWEDKEYFGTTYDASDLVYGEIPSPSEREDVLQAIVDSLGHHTWCDKNPYSLSQAEVFRISWDDFCSAVKHRTRYFFGSIEAPEDLETIPITSLMGTLEELIREDDMLGVLEENTPIYRVRARKRRQVCNSWDSLGPPPPELCVSNRMNAAGISMFYGSLELPTAKAEIAANLDPETPTPCLTAGTWRNTRSLRVLDLTKLSELPNFYALDRYSRDRLWFLHHFVTDISKPVKHDGTIHIDYVPTQVVTEYFRHKYQDVDGSRVDGIVYPSAQKKGGRCIAIFTSQEELDPERERWPSEQGPLLELDPASVRSIRNTIGRKIQSHWSTS